MSDRLKKEIEDLLYSNAPAIEIAKALKYEIKRYYETLEETFLISGGKDFLVKHTRFIDTIVKTAYRVALREMFGGYAPMKNALPLAITALGSYGREQLCVHSDIDVMFVYKQLPGYNAEAMIEKILYLLWDSGLKLGHRVHKADELLDVSRTDITIKTAIIESRLIEGSSFLWTETQNIIDRIRHDETESFIQNKLEERALTHRKYPLMMEPNLKVGVGGFRDANIVFWFGKVLYNAPHIKDLPESIIQESEYRPFRIALEFLFRVRSALHLSTGKKSDTLRLDLIPNVAKLLGFSDNNVGHIKCAKKVIGSMKIITLYTTIWLERLTRKHLSCLSELPLLLPRSQNFSQLLDQLHEACEKPFKAHPLFLDALIKAKKPKRSDTQSKRFMKKVLTKPYMYAALETLSKARLINEVIPPMKHVIDLPQFDGYHRFTVDMHSIRCVYHLEHIDDKFIKSLYDAFDEEQRAIVKLSVYLHDAGKGRKRNHHQVGATLFRIYAQKLGFNKTLIKYGEHLILHHTLMSNVAQREDIYSEKTVMRFASHFPDKILLDMIYVLTYADMKGVGEGIYNSFNAKLIRTLYEHALEALENKKMLDEVSKRRKKEQTLKKTSDFLALEKTQQKKVLQIPSNLMFLRYSPSKILAIAKEAFHVQSYTFLIRNEGYLSIEIIRHPDSPFNLGHLLYKLSHLEVVNMEIFKLFDEKKYFKIEFAHPVEKDEIVAIEQIIQEAFADSRKSVPHPPKIEAKEIEIDCDHSKSYAQMYLKATNQRGLLAYVISIFDERGIDIATAKVHTLKNRVRDMFLIEKNGNFCHNTDEIVNLLTGEKEQCVES